MTMRCTRESAPQQQSRNSEMMTSQATMTSLKLMRMSRLPLPLLVMMLMMTTMTVMMPLVAGIELQAADEAEATNTLEQRGGDKNNASDAYPRQYPSGIPGGGMALPGYGGYGGIGGGVPGFAGNPGAGSFNGAGNFGGVGGGYPGGFAPGIGGGGGVGGAAAPGCPLCDASVYSYCSHKMVHDACCCDFPAQQQKPPQCLYYDCSLLYAKSCYEHSLIKNCCCNNPY